MTKNITLSADSHLIQSAREKAQRENTTLNAEFRAWLTRYVKTDKKLIDFDNLMASFSYARPGKKFTRDQMNER